MIHDLDPIYYIGYNDHYDPYSRRLEMTKTISAVDARHGLGQLMSEVQLKGDNYIIERAGKPVVAVIPIEDFEAWRKLKGGIISDANDSRYPLKGTVVRYDEPFKGISEEDWASSE